MYHFCTITTADHLFKTLSLYDSVRAMGHDSYMHVLCIDVMPSVVPMDCIRFYSISDLPSLPAGDSIISQYSGSKDKLRWSLKPIFLRYLLENKAGRVIYLDNDIYFHDDYRFLFDLMDRYDFLLTPHYYPYSPDRDQNWLEANFKVGLYNAGFIGVSGTAVPYLEWWAKCCAYRCEKNPLRGIFDDQKYLDLIPVINENAHVIRHKGCNVAEWNRSVIDRSEKNGKVVMDGIYPLIFIHYTGTTTRAIREGREPLLVRYFNTYFENLKKHRPDIKVEQLFDKPSIVDRAKYLIWKLATRAGL